ncbi:MAG TPA: glycosyltransferase family 2 protein [Ignavibacteria bacterium]|nr:glycosyltransferase family 2 protein [Ignavibacteria bacterium]HRF66635.1 glycosyltransferase family 2 protein [Ignavibacteria bacterium]HRJ04489.1 glycosyltransferase family 2 protein [Ignavibacteria bacterium]
MDLSIILVNYNVFDDIKVCIKNIYDQLDGLSFEIIVVDNCSVDREIEKITVLFPDVKPIFLDSNFGFGFANNIGIQKATGNYLLLLNPDIIIQDRSIQILFDVIQKNPNAGVVGPIQYKPGAGLEYYYTFFPSLYSRFMQEFGFYMKTKRMKKRFFDFLNTGVRTGKPFKVDWVIGSSMMLRKEIVEKTGGFDEAFFLFEEETEWQYRISKLGYDVLMVPEAKVLHNHHSSTRKIGVMFILYQEYRSRIIFDIKRNEFIYSFFRRLMVINSIAFRFLYYGFTNLTSVDVMKKRIYLYWDLIKLNLSSKEKVAKNRFVFSQFVDYFTNTGNAKL